MKLYILTDNTANGRFFAEHGFSCFIEFENKKVLFDTGHSDIYIKNAQRLEIDIKTVDMIALSHGHWDHTDGLQYLHCNRKPLFCHPDVFMKKYRKRDKSYIGMAMDKATLKQRFDIIETKTPYQLTENSYFLGEIPRKTSFEAQSTVFTDDKSNDDFVYDDTALVFIADKKLVIVTGCSHSGICNIIEYAKYVTGLNEIKAVLGGFHLQKNDKITKKTIDYLKQQNIEHILPSHCTKFPALVALYNEFTMEQVKTGMEFIF